MKEQMKKNIQKYLDYLRNKKYMLLYGYKESEENGEVYNKKYLVYFDRQKYKISHFVSGESYITWQGYGLYQEDVQEGIEHITVPDILLQEWASDLAWKDREKSLREKIRPTLIVVQAGQYHGRYGSDYTMKVWDGNNLYDTKVKAEPRYSDPYGPNEYSLTLCRKLDYTLKKPTNDYVDQSALSEVVAFLAKHLAKKERADYENNHPTQSEKDRERIRNAVLGGPQIDME